MAGLASFILAALTAEEMNLEMLPTTQTGDSSLSPRSVDALGATAFLGAVLICLL